MARSITPGREQFRRQIKKFKGKLPRNFTGRLLALDGTLNLDKIRAAWNCRSVYPEILPLLKIIAAQYKVEMRATEKRKKEVEQRKKAREERRKTAGNPVNLLLRGTRRSKQTSQPVPLSVS